MTARVDIDGEPAGTLTLQRGRLGWTATYRPLTGGRVVRAWRPWKFAAASAAVAHLCPLNRPAR